MGKANTHQITERPANVHSDAGGTEEAFQNDLHIIKHVAGEKGGNGEPKDLKDMVLK